MILRNSILTGATSTCLRNLETNPAGAFQVYNTGVHVCGVDFTTWSMNVAMVSGNLGENSKKRELLERALAIFESAYGTDYPHTEMCQKELAEVRALINSPLHLSAKRGDVDAMTQLLDDGAEVEMEINGKTSLYYACEKGHVDAARLLVKRGADVHRTDSNNCTLLLVACGFGHIEIVQLLLDSGAVSDLDRADNDGDTPMSCANEEGHTAVVDLLEKYASESDS